MHLFAHVHKTFLGSVAIRNASDSSRRTYARGMDPHGPESSTARIGVVTVSDRASRGEYEDRGGPAIERFLEAHLTSEWSVVRRLVPDEQPAIEACLRELCDEAGCCLVVTTGGTGPALRDVTPEAKPWRSLTS
jgi:hypothetical protein